MLAEKVYPFLCLGKVNLPPGGGKLIILPGSTARIEWSYDVDASKVYFRVWYFKSSDGSLVPLAFITHGGDPHILKSSLPRVDIEKPATLVLKNVDLSFNGTYLFQLIAPGGGRSEVVLFVAGK